MNTISVSYVLVWSIPETPYRFTKDGKCFNIKTGRQIKKTVCGGSIGYCIGGKFESLDKIRPQLKKISNNWFD